MDQLIFQYIHNLSGHYLLLDLFGIFLAQYLPYLMSVVLIVLIVKKKEKAKRLYFLFLVILSLLAGRGLVVETIRFFYPKLRPFVVLNFNPLITGLSSAAFPSGHAVLVFVLAAAAFFVSRQWFPYFLGGAVLTSLARVYVGVHWPTDVLAGALLGTAIVLILQKLLPKLKL